MLSACVAQSAPTTLPDSVPTTPAPPPAPTSAPDGVAAEAIALYDSLTGDIDLDAVFAIGDSGDVRYAWILSDLLRFFGPGETSATVVEAFEQLAGVVLAGETSPWLESTNYLISADTTAPPGYQQLKGQLYTIVDTRWAPFFDDPNSEIEYRHLGFGGVGPDDRSLGSREIGCAESCIPALDDPAVTDAAGGDWYPDDGIVFGVDIGGEARAYPKNIMEIHEMVIDTVGGVRVGIPYCTLCGSAQAYDLESIPDGFDPPVLRTSGLLVRSNKLMYDLNTWSAFDTFTGRALSGPLHDADVHLDMVTIITSTWGAWKEAHPGTTIVASDGGIGRTYAVNPLRGRDDNGPIFPTGDVDARLPVQEQVLGVETPDGVFIAFPADSAREVLIGGQPVGFLGVRLSLDGDGLRASLDNGTPLATHQAFWFAWSQFHPTTELWSPELLGS